MATVSNIVSLTVFEIFEAYVLWSKFRTVQGHPRSSKVKGHGVNRCRHPIRFLLT